MKNFILLFVTLFALNSFGAEVEVISAELGLEDYNQEKTLCLTVVKVPERASLLAVVEDIGDCFYALKAHRGESVLDVDLDKLQVIHHPELREHLQKRLTQLEFYFSDGE